MPRLEQMLQRGPMVTVADAVTLAQHPDWFESFDVVRSPDGEVLKSPGIAFDPGIEEADDEPHEPAEDVLDRELEGMLIEKIMHCEEIAARLSKPYRDALDALRQSQRCAEEEQ